LYRIALIAIFVLLYPAFAVGEEIQVLDADVNFRTGLQQPGVHSGDYPPGIIIRHADINFRTELEQPGFLNADYPPRIIVRHADVNFRTELERPGFPSGDAPPRIIVRHADVNFRTGLVWGAEEPNSPPTAPTLSSPGDGSTIGDRTPTLTVNNSTDPDGDSLTYEFQLDDDVNLQSPVASVTGLAEGVAGKTSWNTLSQLIDGTYYWRARAYDGQAYSGWMTPASFTIISGEVAERSLSITSAEAAPGTTAAVHITITDVSDMAGADMVVKYDASVLTVDEVKYTDLVLSLNPTANTGTPGEIVIGMASSTAIASGSGALVEIKLTVDPNAQVGTETALNLEDAEIYDELGGVIPTSSQSGVVKITQPGIRGDVNRDGEVKSNDAILTLRIATRQMTPSDYEKWAADMNGDGEVKSNDAILILRKAIRLDAPGIDALASSGTQITVAMAEVHGVVGQSIAVPVEVDNTYGLAGGDICIAYDPGVLRAVDVSSEFDTLLSSNIANPGLVRVAFASIHGLRSKTIADVRFEVLTDDVSPLEFKLVDLYQPNALPRVARKVDGRFTSWAKPPERSALLQSFPNPSNPETWIPYQLREGSQVTIRIYSVTGDLLRKLDLGYKPAGVYVSPHRAARWDGRNESGEKVTSGIYFCVMEAGSFRATKKIVISR